MKSKDFIIKLLWIVQNFKTVYMWGTFGSAVKESLIQEKSVQYAEWYTQQKQSSFRQLVGKNFFAFDCVGLIKAVLWGWSGDKIKAFGGLKYNSNGVPDTSANGMLKYLKDVTTDFTNIVPGEAVWMDGHIGVYIGEGKVVECTPAWENGCQITACGNIMKINGLKSRTWTKHGKLPWIEYEVEQEVKKEAEHVRILKLVTSRWEDWLKFFEEMKNHPIGKFLPELIVKVFNFKK